MALISDSWRNVKSEVDLGILMLRPLFPINEEDFKSMKKPRVVVVRPKGGREFTISDYLSICKYDHELNELRFAEGHITLNDIGANVGEWLYNYANPEIYHNFLLCHKKWFKLRYAKTKEENEKKREYWFLSNQYLRLHDIFASFCGIYHSDTGREKPESSSDALYRAEEWLNGTSLEKWVGDMLLGAVVSKRIAENLYKYHNTDDTFRHLTKIGLEEARTNLELLTGIDLRTQES